MFFFRKYLYDNNPDNSPAIVIKSKNTPLEKDINQSGDQNEDRIAKNGSSKKIEYARFLENASFRSARNK